MEKGKSDYSFNWHLSHVWLNIFLICLSHLYLFSINMSFLCFPTEFLIFFLLICTYFYVLKAHLWFLMWLLFLFCFGICQKRIVLFLMIAFHQLHCHTCINILFFKVKFIHLLWLWVSSYSQKGIPTLETIKTKTNPTFSSDTSGFF